MTNTVDYTHPQWIERRKPKSSADLLDVARGITGDKLLLSFSGKDSLAMWLYLRENGFSIIPYLLYTVPLRIDVEMREYYQDFFGQKIYFLPHPIFYHMLALNRFQPPHIAARLTKLDLPFYDFKAIEDVLASENGMENYLSAVGYLAGDQAGRRSFIVRSGPIGITNRKYYMAIWDWKASQVMDKMHQYKVKLPYHYRVWGNTGTGRPYEYLGLKELEKFCPDDYELLLKWFPLKSVEKFRYEVVNEYAKSHSRN